MGGETSDGGYVSVTNSKFTSSTAPKVVNFYKPIDTNKWNTKKVEDTKSYADSKGPSYSPEKDQLGDLEASNDKKMIQKLRNLKCIPELSGETLVLWNEPDTKDP